MVQIMKDQSYRPCHFDPMDKKDFQVDHIARFFWCQLTRAIKWLTSIEDCWSTCKALDAVGAAKMRMPWGAFSDMQGCMYFADNWEEEDGVVSTDMFADVKVEVQWGVAHHCSKFAIVEDAFNAKWKATVIFGRRLTIDESCISGWYKGPITQGPKPKPFRHNNAHPLCHRRSTCNVQVVCSDIWRQDRHGY